MRAPFLYIYMYYENLISKVKKLIKINKFNESYKILSEELSLSYVPQKYEDQLQKLFEIVNNKIFLTNDKKNTVSKISFEHIKMALTGNKDLNMLDKVKYISQISDINPLPLKKNIQFFLSDNENNEALKTLLIESLNKTLFNENLKIVKYNKEYIFNPKNFYNIYKTKTFESVKKFLYDLFYINSPNLFLHGIKLLEIYTLYTFPEKIPDDENIYLGISIYHFINTSFNNSSEDLISLSSRYKINNNELCNFYNIFLKVICKIKS